MMYDYKYELSEAGRPWPGPRQGRTSRGDSGALYLQSATAGMNPGPRNSVVPSDPDKQR